MTDDMHVSSSDWLRRHREQQRARLDEARRAFLGRALQAGVAKVEADYDGSGDEGWINDVSLLDKDGNPIARGAERGAWSATPQAGDQSLVELATTLAYQYLEVHAPGWEINEGSFGTLVIDLDHRAVRGDHHVRVETSEPEPFNDTI